MRLEGFIRLIGFLTAMTIVASAALRETGVVPGAQPERADVIVGIILPHDVPPDEEAELLRLWEVRERSGRVQPIRLRVERADAPGEAARAARHLVRDAGAIAIVAECGAQVRGALAESARSIGVPLLATTPSMEGAGGDSVMDLAGVRSQRVLPALAWGLRTFGPSVGLVTDNRPSARDVRRLVERRVAALGRSGDLSVEVVAASASSIELTAIAERIALAPPSFLLVDIDGPHAAGIVAALRRAGVDPARVPCVHLSATPEDAGEGSSLPSAAVSMVGDYRVVTDRLDAPSGPVTRAERIECALLLISEAARRVGTGHVDGLAGALRQARARTFAGELVIDPETGDAWCDVRLVRFGPQGRDETLWRLPRVRPDAALVEGSTERMEGASDD